MKLKLNLGAIARAVIAIAAPIAAEAAANAIINKATKIAQPKRGR